jgi:hypothetical protein
LALQDRHFQMHCIGTNDLGISEQISISQEYLTQVLWIGLGSTPLVSLACIETLGSVCTGVRFIRNKSGQPIIDRSYNLVQLLGAYGTHIQASMLETIPLPTGSAFCTQRVCHLPLCTNCVSFSTTLLPAADALLSIES